VIPQTQREQLVALLHEYSEEYSPWAVMLVFADTMRDVFRRMEHDEAMERTAKQRPKRARKQADKAGPMAPVRDAQLEVDRLNREMPEGTPVVYYPGPREHGGRDCTIRGAFFLTGVNGEIGGWVTGQAGYVRASHIEKR
jgi:hypothetical protein